MQLRTAPTNVAESSLGSASGEKFARFRQFALSTSRRVLQNVYAAVLIIEKEQYESIATGNAEAASAHAKLVAAQAELDHLDT